jgi:hypothetical protein
MVYTQSMIPEDFDLADVVALPQAEHGEDDTIIQLHHHKTGWGRSMLLSEIEPELQEKLGLKEKSKAKAKAAAPKKTAPTGG